MREEDRNIYNFVTGEIHKRYKQTPLSFNYNMTLKKNPPVAIQCLQMHIYLYLVPKRCLATSEIKSFPQKMFWGKKNYSVRKDNLVCLFCPAAPRSRECDNQSI